MKVFNDNEQEASDIVLAVIRERQLRQDLFFGKCRASYLKKARSHAINLLYDGGFSLQAIRKATQCGEDTVRRALTHADNSRRRHRPAKAYVNREAADEIRAIVDRAIQEHGITAELFFGGQQHEHIVAARADAAKRLMATNKMSISAIGRAVGRCNSVVRHYLDNGEFRAMKHFMARTKTFETLTHEERRQVERIAHKNGQKPSILICRWISERLAVEHAEIQRAA